MKAPLRSVSAVCRHAEVCDVSVTCAEAAGFCCASVTLPRTVPKIVAHAGQRIRWYVFDLDLGMGWHNFHTHAQRWTFADQRAARDEPRSVNYLKNEWAERVKAGPVRYLLQIQWHDVRPDDPDVIRNPLEPWDEATHPWADLAEVEITELLGHEEQDHMAFEVTNLPPCMALLPARSMQDYNSLNYMRKHAIWSVRARWLMARLLGTPKPYKDTDAAKVRNRRPRGI